MLMTLAHISGTDLHNINYMSYVKVTSLT